MGEKKGKKSAARRKLQSAAARSGGADFAALVETIREIHERIAAIVGRAVNVGLTVRNWLIGWYIREYEQAGEDRATYGAALLDKLSERLVAAGFQELTPRYLRLCRQFAAVYPQIWRSMTAKSALADDLPSQDPPRNVVSGLQ